MDPAHRGRCRPHHLAPGHRRLRQVTAIPSWADLPGSGSHSVLLTVWWWLSAGGKIKRYPFGLGRMSVTFKEEPSMTSAEPDSVEAYLAQVRGDHPASLHGLRHRCNPCGIEWGVADSMLLMTANSRGRIH